MELQEQLLKLNPETGYYEATFTVRVEAEIFRRVLFTYVEDHHIDPTDLVAWEKAVHEVASTAKWRNHPRAEIQPVEAHKTPSSQAEPKVEAEPLPPTTKYLPPEDEQQLWGKARVLPIDEWETLLTPLPDELSSRDVRKRPFYVRRMVERKSLEKLREQLYPVSERMEAVAEAINGNRIR